MKKLTLALAAASLLSSAAFAADGFASGEVQFYGEVNTAPCDVTVSNNGRVHLGSYSVSSLDGPDAKGEWGYQDIQFKNCDLDSGTGEVTLPNVSIKVLDGTADATRTDVWKNYGLAENVGIEIQVDGKKISPIGSDAIETKLTGVDNIVKVAGRMVKTSDVAAAPGTVTTNITFNATFK